MLVGKAWVGWWGRARRKVGGGVERKRRKDLKGGSRGWLGRTDTLTGGTGRGGRIWMVGRDG